MIRPMLNAHSTIFRRVGPLEETAPRVHPGKFVTESYTNVPLLPSTSLLAYIHTYLLTPQSRVLLETLTGSQLVKKFPAFYGTRRSITAFTSARHLSVSWARSIQSMPPIPLL